MVATVNRRAALLAALLPSSVCRRYLVTAKLRERRRGAFDEADAELRRLIREGFESGIPGEQLAEPAGLSVPRVYQIRDGRR
jgi:hypothetical protein